MDVNRLNMGERIAGVAGVLLILIMFIFSWFSVEGAGDLGGINAWESFSFIDFILFLAALSAIALAVVAASQTDVDMPIALSSITAGLGVLATVLIVFRIIATPEFDVPFGGEIETDRSLGVFLGLIAAGAIAYGGWTAMQEEGTSFTEPPDRDRGTAPPPPSSTPPPAQ